jgi:hypothetical protein
MLVDRKIGKRISAFGGITFGRKNKDRFGSKIEKRQKIKLAEKYFSKISIIAYRLY